MNAPRDLAVTRVRRPVKLRSLEVKFVRPLSNHLVRVTLGGPDLDDFETGSFDDHVKLFFPAPGATDPVLPRPEPTEGGAKPIARDFTPRRFDRAARELDIEFVLHHPGPASQWAEQARPGQKLGVGGPRGSFIIPTGFDWHLLIGDDTALPAIARRIEELPKGAAITAIIEAPDRSGEIEIAAREGLRIVWLHRDADGDGALLAALGQWVLPEGEGFVWAAGEAAAIRALRQHLRFERGIDKSRIRAAAYWKQGEAAVHENLED